MILIWHTGTIQGVWELQDAAMFASVHNLFECMRSSQVFRFYRDLMYWNYVS
jgi:hypothetical protein